MHNLCNNLVTSNGKVIFPSQVADLLYSGCSSIPKTVNGDTTLDFAETKNIAYILQVNSSSNITINKGVQGQLQKMTLIVNNLSDGNVVTLSSEVTIKGAIPFIKSSKGFSLVEIIFDGYSTIYMMERLNG